MNFFDKFFSKKPIKDSLKLARLDFMIACPLEILTLIFEKMPKDSEMVTVGQDVYRGVNCLVIRSVEFKGAKDGYELPIISPEITEHRKKDKDELDTGEVTHYTVELTWNEKNNPYVDNRKLQGS